MSHGYFSYTSKDNVRRKLTVQVEVLRRAVAAHKRKREDAEQQVKEWEKKYKEIEKENEKLKKENEEIRRQRDTYKNMLFKKNVEKQTLLQESELLTHTPQKKRGGQPGHKGYGRALPKEVAVTKRVHAPHCPDCHRKLKRSSAITTHIVEDIPAPQLVKPIVTQYRIERQWCSTCKKEVTACPVEVIPGSKLGIYVIVYIMILKYAAKVPLDAIVLLLQTQYSLTISKGGIINILHRTKKWLGPHYQKIKQDIKASPLVHADETGWRVQGINKWVWAYLSQDSVCYEIEESRGKGVPQEFLKDSNPHAVLVRDDYAAYESIDLPQQSCWAHCLRKSHEAIKQDTVSSEMKELHLRLKTIYETLEEVVQKPFDYAQRNATYTTLLKDIRAIMKTNYKSEDAVKVQTRVKNQNENLLTALLYEGIPLTNNHAERNIRPIVVTRKISGGSQSPQGAYTHMLNMSVLQTTRLKKQPLTSTLKDQLLAGVFGNN